MHVSMISEINRATYNGTQDGDEESETFAISQGKGLPEKQAPSKEQKHVASTSIECIDRNPGFFRDWDQY